MTKHGKIGEFLVSEALITADQLDRGHERHQKNGGSPGKALADLLKPVEPKRLAARVMALAARSRGPQIAASA